MLAQNFWNFLTFHQVLKKCFTHSDKFRRPYKHVQWSLKYKSIRFVFVKFLVDVIKNVTLLVWFRSISQLRALTPPTGNQPTSLLKYLFIFGFIYRCTFNQMQSDQNKWNVNIFDCKYHEPFAFFFIWANSIQLKYPERLTLSNIVPTSGDIINTVFSKVDFFHFELKYVDAEKTFINSSSIQVVQFSK